MTRLELAKKIHVTSTAAIAALGCIVDAKFEVKEWEGFEPKKDDIFHALGNLYNVVVEDAEVLKC